MDQLDLAVGGEVTCAPLWVGQGGAQVSLDIHTF